MTLGKTILIGLLGLVVAEAAVFLAVAEAIGGFAALLLMFGASVLGGLILMRMGRRLAATFSGMLGQRNIASLQVSSRSFLIMAAALLLIIPGFISDVIGLLLLIPAVQRQMHRVAPKGMSETRRPPPDEVVDLEPGQWRDVKDQPVKDKPRPDHRDRDQVR